MPRKSPIAKQIPSEAELHGLTTDRIASVAAVEGKSPGVFCKLHFGDSRLWPDLVNKTRSITLRKYQSIHDTLGKLERKHGANGSSR